MQLLSFASNDQSALCQGRRAAAAKPFPYGHDSAIDSAPADGDDAPADADADAAPAGADAAPAGDKKAGYGNCADADTTDANTKAGPGGENDNTT